MSKNIWDYRFMAAAARLSRRHLGMTAENPSVGALIVCFDGEVPVIVGRGITAKSGRPHAEVQALQESGSQAQGATAYATLEPCSHYGKTAPCAKALIEARIKRVVISYIDPDKRVCGQGITKLREAGIEVDLIKPNEDVRAVLSGYMIRKSQNRPQITIKMAFSADDAIGRKGQGFIPISSPLSRERTHILRAETDAILVGIGTVLADDPILNCRLPGLQERSPIRIILDTDLKVPLTSKIVKTAFQFSTWIVCDKNSKQQQKDSLKEQGITIIEIDTDVGRCDLHSLMQLLGKQGISNLLVEGGQKVAESFYDTSLCDRLIIFQSKVKIGNNAIKAPSFKNLEKAYQKMAIDYFEDDICTTWQRI